MGPQYFPRKCIDAICSHFDESLTVLFYSAPVKSNCRLPERRSEQLPETQILDKNANQNSSANTSEKENKKTDL